MTTATCKTCSNTFTVQCGKRRCYCSAACYAARRSVNEAYPSCGVCGAVIRRYGAKYCSRVCTTKALAGKARPASGTSRVDTCVGCGCEIRTYASVPRLFCSSPCRSAHVRRAYPTCRTCGVTIDRHGAIFCSLACRGVAKRGKPRPGHVSPLVDRSCRQCGGTFQTGGRAGGRKHSAQFCSDRCAKLATRVPLHDATGRPCSLFATAWKELRKQVRERDGKQCRFCDRTYNLQCHHLVPREHGGTHDTSNLATVCRRCHRVVDGMLTIMLAANPTLDIAAWYATFIRKLPESTPAALPVPADAPTNSDTVVQ